MGETFVAAGMKGVILTANIMTDFACGLRG